MRDNDITVLVQIASLAVSTLIDCLRNTPKTQQEADALDRAALELIAKTSDIADAVRARLGVPDTTDYPPPPSKNCPTE